MHTNSAYFSIGIDIPDHKQRKNAPSILQTFQPSKTWSQKFLISQTDEIQIPFKAGSPLGGKMLSREK